MQGKRKNNKKSWREDKKRLRKVIKVRNEKQKKNYSRKSLKNDENKHKDIAKIVVLQRVKKIAAS